jgi:SAM-dependent methyltransferase
MQETPYVREPGYAERYRDRRFAAGTGPRTHAREAATLRRLLARAGPRPGRWLDVPSGAGRMTGLLPGPVVQVDRSLAMVRAAPAGAWRACASAAALPFRDGEFAGALCLRLLQHLPASGERRAILAELARVVRGPVIVSYFDRCSVQHLRRVLRRRLGRASRRSALGWAALRAELEGAGLAVRARAGLSRFWSEQVLVLATSG